MLHQLHIIKQDTKAHNGFEGGNTEKVKGLVADNRGNHWLSTNPLDYSSSYSTDALLWVYSLFRLLSNISAPFLSPSQHTHIAKSLSISTKWYVEQEGKVSAARASALGTFQVEAQLHQISSCLCQAGC